MTEAGISLENKPGSTPAPNWDAKRNRQTAPAIIWFLLIVILASGAYFRFIGTNWDDSQHLHPDERFLTMVESALTPVKSLSQFFDTAHSTMNPHNVGYEFFVYGTLPIFIIRYLAEAVGMTGYDQVNLVGRVASGAVDLMAVLLVFLIAQKLFKRHWLSLMATAFYSTAVLPIQLSHYMAVDTFTNTFALLAFYFAVVIMTQEPVASSAEAESGGWDWLKHGWRGVGPFLWFGVAYGMALASKVSIVPLAVLLPGAAGIAWTRLSPVDRRREWLVILRNLVLAGILAVIVFRFGQPYAFKGPGFFGIIPNDKWINNLQALSVQTNGDGDSPPELQWARRPISFTWDNLTNWGLGLPLGMLATVGYLWMGWKIIRGRWREYSLIWVWTGAYFLWQGLSFTRAMRYEIPIYPLLVIIAAWIVFMMSDAAPKWSERLPGGLARVNWIKVISLAVGAGVMLASFGWAFAFTRIYDRPMTRVAASEWIYQNVPGPVNLHIQTPQGLENSPLSTTTESIINPENGILTIFAAQEDGTLVEITLSKATLIRGVSGGTQITVEIGDAELGNQTLGSGSRLLSGEAQGQTLTIPLDPIVSLKKGHRYGLKLGIGGAKNPVNLEGEIVLKVAGLTNQIDLTLDNVDVGSGRTFAQQFIPQAAGSVQQLTLPVDLATGSTPFEQGFNIVLIANGGNQVATANQIVTLSPGMAPPVIHFASPIQLESGQPYLVSVDIVTRTLPVHLNGTLKLQLLDGFHNQVLPAPVQLIQPDSPLFASFTARSTGQLREVTLGWAAQQDPNASGPDTLTLSITDPSNGLRLSETRVTRNLLPVKDPRGTPVTFTVDPPVPMEKGNSYILELTPSQGAISLRGSAPANESTWDDGLPLRMDNLDGYGGIYQRGLNFEMYWEDNADKLARFSQTLDQADYVFISSNRQWGTTSRVQERYPLTTEYYRSLLGCPADKSIVWCYSVAQPGMFQSQLGFQLVQVFQSNPNLGDWQFNDQFGEEAFTVYDHPKVLIFKKTADYSSVRVQDLLGKVDLSKVVQVTPRKAGIPANLLLPSEQLGQQQEGGSWSELFNPDSALNRWPGVGLVVWYLFVLLLGWLVYPFVRLALGGLEDRGYPLARLVGMLVLAYIVWLAGSSGAPFTHGTIWLALAGLLIANLIIFIWQRGDILRELKQRKKYYLLIEGIFLAFFIIDLLIRFGNPDLWHPAKGGEKPMDFSYLNAVLKSTSFPPYDPWFAGGYINYYYYGFVLVGVVIKALGIIPEVAYNLVLPTLFAMVAVGAFSVGWNLLSRNRDDESDATLTSGSSPKSGRGGEDARPTRWLGVEKGPLIAGLSAAVGMLILGNMGTINMIWEGFQLLVVPRDVMDQANLFSRLGWTLQGFAKYFAGNPLPYNIGEWYWNPSRAIPTTAGNPITEFPFFTFLYADLHAHLIALPVTVLGLDWGIGILRGQWKWGEGKSERWAWFQFALCFGLGGLAIGALWPTNTWDMPAYLTLTALAVAYTALRYAPPPQRLLRLVGSVKRFFAEMGDGPEPEKDAGGSTGGQWMLKISAIAIPAVLLLVGLAFVLYQPFSAWNGRNNAIDLYKGIHTPDWAYRMHWGVFLFVIVSWLIWETLDWMVKTPVSALNKLRSIWPWIVAVLAGMVLAIVYFIVAKIEIGWIPLVLGVWAVALMFRPGQPDSKRAVLFMTGSALALTLLVEIVVLRDDIDRMNTVFKFYLQAWTLFAISAGAALAWLLPAALRRVSSWRTAWQVVLIALVGSAALFPLLAGQAKIEDRMAAGAPLTLNGMTYMDYSTYSDKGQDMNLSEDYRAILWMQANVKGSPVIVEANAPEYRWGTRFTIYTGLPGVVGWNWHQRQQRALTSSDWVTERVSEIGEFYNSHNESFVNDFLQRYNVSYIIVGQLERAYYPTGLDKFDEWNGKDWKEVYRDGLTAIYEVLQ